MQASIKTKLLVVCILLVFLTTLSISIAYYFLAKQDKHRESQQRLQIALEIILDDLNSQSQFYAQKIEDSLQRDETFRTAVNIYLQDQNPLERNIGLRPFLVSQLAKLKHITSVDRLALYFAGGRLLASYPPMAPSSEETRTISGMTQTVNQELPNGLSSSLFREHRKLGFRITAPFFRDEKMAGMLIAEVFVTQSMLEHYRSLSKTEINFFAGEQFSLGTLAEQTVLEPEWLTRRLRCNDLPEKNRDIEVMSARLNGQDYYQSGCLLCDTQGATLGAITVSLSQVVEKQAIQQIFTTVSIIAGTGIIVSIVLVLGLVVPTFTEPIITLTRAASEIAQGNLQQTIDTSRNDELGVLARSFAHMRSEIQKKISELQQLNEQLEQRVKERTAELSQEKYILDTFMATVPSRIYFKDCEGRITRANMAHARRLGLQSPSEELGKTDFDFFPEEEALKRYEQEQGIIQSGQPVINQELAMRGSDGELIWSLVTRMPLRDEHGAIIGIFGISRDITDLKRTEQELAQYRDRLEDLVKERTAELVRINDRLQEEIAERRRIEDALRLSEEQYRILAENVMDGVVIVQNGVLVFSNVVFATMLGHPRKSLLQKDSINFFHARSKPLVKTRLYADSPKFSDPRWHAELSTRMKQIIWAEIDQTSISWHGKPACLLTVRDITDRKLKEKRLEKERAQLQQENITLRSTVAERYKFGELIGKSPVMQHIYELIVSAAASEVNVLICGESGTGKELIARTIHQMSQRKDQAFVPVNCASIPDTLFEREFFGHRKGAFTGAERDKPGLFDQAHQGTLFLDEVTELHPGMQAKLLRVLQDGVYTPLGSPKSKQADVVIVAATNKAWKPLIEQGRLRQDFFYRICVIEVQTPPLRDRKDDLPLLIDFFLERYRLKQERIHHRKFPNLPVAQTMLPSEVIQALYAYDWPGNVRELQNVLQRYLATKHLDQNIFFRVTRGGEQRTPGVTMLEPQHGMTLPEAVNALEKQMIATVLAQNNNHRLKTAQILGITRRALQYKLKKYSL